MASNTVCTICYCLVPSQYKEAHLEWHRDSMSLPMTVDLLTLHR